jgi:hypothetical protein
MFEVLLLIVRQMLMTSSNSDGQVRSLRLKIRVVAIPFAERTDVLSLPASPESQTFRWILRTAPSPSVHDRLDYSTVCSCLVPKNVTDDHGARLLELLVHLTYYADQGKQFLQFSATGNEMLVSDTTPEIKGASVT